MENEEQNIQNAAGAETDEAISRLLSGLKRVDAPGDFDIRVRARIASARPAKASGSWLPAAVRVAVPAGLLVTLAGYLAFNSFYSPINVAPPAVADIQPANFVSASEPPATMAAAGNPNELVPADRTTVKPNETGDNNVTGTQVKRTSSQRPPVDRSGGLSTEETLRIRNPLYPKGLNPNRRDISNQSAVTGNSVIQAKDVLSAMGIDPKYSGTAWTVGSVRSNTAAERSGLKAGDVIEAINEKPVTGTTSFDGKFSGKSVRVRRDGKSVQIDLKP